MKTNLQRSAVNYNPQTNFHLHLVQTPRTDSQKSPYEEILKEKVDAFKEAVFQTIENENQKKAFDYHKEIIKIAHPLGQLTASMQEILGFDSPISNEEKDYLGNQIRKELAPILLMANIPQRSYTKPRGYAGDFLTISNMYDNIPIGVNKTGEIIDQIFLNNTCIKAVKNRRFLLKNEIESLISQNKGEAVNICSFASGPAQELFDANEIVQANQKVSANLIDIDFQALAFVERKLEENPLKIKVNLHQENLIYLSIGRREIKLPEQDLVYSIGLIDYFNDDLVIKLINYAHSILKKGGQLVLGNFHKDNPIKPFMDHVLNWKLIHRTEEDMNRLFQASAFGKDCSAFKYEEEGINMFAFGTK